MTDPQPESLVKRLARYGIHPAKPYGQHFLLDRHYLGKLIEPPELAEVRTILEVGPGPGNLTELLVNTGTNVISVEIDERFARLLTDRFGQAANFRLFQGDILAKGGLNPEVTALLRERWDRPWALVSNLPYQVGTVVIVEVLHLPVRPAVVCVMVQREVAARLAAKAGGKDYSALSVLAQAYMEVRRLAVVPPGAFWPPPKVDSAIVKMTARPEAAVRDPAGFRDMVNLMFQHRRKTLRSGFLGRLGTDLRRRYEQAFEEMGIDPAKRAEQLDIYDFIGLGNRIAAVSGGGRDDAQPQ